MRIIDILNAPKCKTIFYEIQEFVKQSLFEYNNAIERDSKREGFCFPDKDIFDFVWGTVNFSGTEICVLDSPLLQRLRRIHQLGLASSVYCNADSSRFSHTIGVTEVSDRMAKVIKKRLNMTIGEGQEKRYDIGEIVRLAAIFHDTGHMFFSHVSELYFSYDKSFPRYEEVLSAMSYFCVNTSSSVSLHELFSVMIVNSEETLRLFKLIAPHMKKSRLVQKEHYEQLAEYISCLIIGIPVDKFILPYSAIINSAIDSDKLDYLSRDSACTKVPIAVDIARIIQKLDVVNIKEIDYPTIWNDTTSDAVPLKIMAIKSSAKKVFWQLSNARSNMYESVYYHHKILTVESMFRKMLRNLYEIKDETNLSFTKIMKLTDDMFNEYWDLILLKPEMREAKGVEVVSELIKNIRERNLYKRVASFSRNSFKGSLSSIKNFFNQVIQDPLGYYNDALYLLQDENFTRLLNAKTFKVVIDKYRSFLGADSCQITEESLNNFLRQFLWLDMDKKDLVVLLDGILKLLESAYYLDRESFAAQVGKLIEELSILQYSDKHIVTLGGLFDSAKHLMYYFNDIKGGKNVIFDGSLESALKNTTENDCLCFFDDGAYSGKQVISIFQELMGVPVDERTTNEHHVDELAQENKEKIKKINIVLAYLCFNKQSERYIKEELKRLGIENITILFVKDLSEKIFDNDSSVFSNNEQKELVKKWLAEIGYTILLSSKRKADGEYKPRWNEKRIQEAALGYNNAQQLVIFSTNIPTYSITAFWANGDYGTHKWKGLFQRTVKD